METRLKLPARRGALMSQRGDAEYILLNFARWAAFGSGVVASSSAVAWASTPRALRADDGLPESFDLHWCGSQARVEQAYAGTLRFDLMSDGLAASLELVDWRPPTEDVQHDLERWCELLRIAPHPEQLVLTDDWPVGALRGELPDAAWFRVARHLEVLRSLSWMDEHPVRGADPRRAREDWTSHMLQRVQSRIRALQRPAGPTHIHLDVPPKR